MPRGRFVVTALAVLCVIGLGRVPLPGFPHELLPLDGPRVRAATSIAALGVMPFVAASMLVELVTLVFVEPWRRRDVALQRRRFALWFGGAICWFQAYGIAKMAASIPIGDAFEPAGSISFTLMASLAAGSALMLAIAAVIDRHGAGAGLVTVFAADVVGGWRWDDPERTSGAVGTFVIFVLAVWALTWHRDLGPTKKGEVVSPVIPEPLGGLMGAGFAVTAIQYYAPYVELPPERWLGSLAVVERWPFLNGVGGALLAALLGVGVAYAFYTPSRVARLWARIEPRASAEEITQVVRGEVRDAAVRTGLLAAAGFAIAWVVEADLFIGLFVAAALVDLYRDRSPPANLVCVDEETRPWAATAKLVALRRANLDPFQRGSALPCLFPLVGPLCPTLLYVPEEERDRATVVLDRLEVEKAAAPTKRPEVARVESGRGPSALVIAVLGLVVLGALAWPEIERARRIAEDDAGGDGPPVSFALMRVADDLEVISREMAIELEGTAFPRLEDVPLGPGRTEPRPYLFVEPLGNEPIETTRGRVAAALSKYLPPKTTIAWGDVTEFDRSSDTFVHVGFRTFLLDEKILDEGDIVDAVAESDLHGGSTVSIKLTKDGGDRFAAATREAINRRIAIVVDGKVESAPVVQGEITGGNLRITMGSSSPDEQLRQANDIARKLRRASRKAR